ncbi:hypothetical protein Patl1_19371 [Pistacia atlantica]|uniref:Uncharacterized protein n=1 Tax=Pistacia atlantica TaxID=434234 RepID=A0ACC1BZT3_9ROSI|nr:hypothetical protein Patl1_19371 [Pistacia atlantica]
MWVDLKVGVLIPIFQPFRLMWETARRSRYTQDYDMEEVSQLLYTTCNTDSKKPNQVYNDDDTIISLTQPGDLYFISGNFCRTLRLYVYVDPRRLAS